MKAEFHNVWRDVLVPVELMNRITALCDVLEGQDTFAGRTAAFIRHEINIGLSFYPNWHEVDDAKDPGKPVEGDTYYCVDEGGNAFTAEYGGLDDNGRQAWFIYRDAAIRVHPTYWCTLPHTPYEDLRDPLRDPSER